MTFGLFRIRLVCMEGSRLFPTNTIWMASSAESSRIHHSLIMDLWFVMQISSCPNGLIRNSIPKPSCGAWVDALAYSNPYDTTECWGSLIKTQLHCPSTTRGLCKQRQCGGCITRFPLVIVDLVDTYSTPLEEKRLRRFLRHSTAETPLPMRKM